VWASLSGLDDMGGSLGSAWEEVGVRSSEALGSISALSSLFVSWLGLWF
jgi:hypothetical protein